MKLAKFIQNKSINNSKYIIKGYATSIEYQDNIEFNILYIFMNNIKGKNKNNNILIIKYNETGMNTWYD